MEIKLEHKNALVTGANSGIGEAVALALAAAGADVAINYVVNPDAAKKVSAQIESMGRKSLRLKADISEPAAVDKMFHEVDKAWGGGDILVNNAGIDGKRAVAWKADPQAWRKVLEVNLFGSFYCARAALQGMTKRKSGVVLNIASVHETIPWEGYSAYTASKAGTGMMTKTLAMEAAPFGVRVLALAPGAIQTPTMAKSLGMHVIAEGVETDEECAILRRFGCPAFQGFLFSRPKPLVAFEELLAGHGGV